MTKAVSTEDVDDSVLSHLLKNIVRVPLHTIMFCVGTHLVAKIVVSAGTVFAADIAENLPFFTKICAKTCKFEGTDIKHN
jgi:hypothetical protein